MIGPARPGNSGSVPLRRRPDWHSGQWVGDLMYVPAQFAVDNAELGKLLTGHGAADLVTATSHGLLATVVPFVYDPGSASTAPCWGIWRGTTISGVTPCWARRW